jgi:hypothetical protein
MTLDKVLMPVLDGHPDVFERGWPLRVADIDRHGRLRLDAAARHIQDVGQDHVHDLGFDDSHPLWVVRRTMIDLIRPIEFQDMLRLRRWCSGTSTPWCETRVRIDGGKGGLIESEAFWINRSNVTLRASPRLRSQPPSLRMMFTPACRVYSERVASLDSAEPSTHSTNSPRPKSPRVASSQLRCVPH